MKRGFTLLELVVVIIILGILATLGITHYGRMIERSRGAEARAILGAIRSYTAAYYMENNRLTGIADEKLGLGTALDQIPTACRTSHYFSYTYIVVDPMITITATRCVGGAGKVPSGNFANTLTISSNVSTGVDLWGGTGGY